MKRSCLLLGGCGYVSTPETQTGQRDDDPADKDARSVVRDAAEGEIPQYHAGRCPRKQSPQVVPLGVFSIGEYGDEVAEYQQRQHQAAGLFAAGKYMIE